MGGVHLLETVCTSAAVVGLFGSSTVIVVADIPSVEVKSKNNLVTICMPATQLQMYATAFSVKSIAGGV